MIKIIFVCIGLGVGGTEKTLVEAINVLDKSKYDISLYIRKDRNALVDRLNSGVTIITNNNAPVQEKRLYSRLCITFSRICSLFSKKLENKFRRAQRKYVLRKRTEYEAKTYFENDTEYDFAVAYDMAEECIKFVSRVVSAKKKIAFHHSSTLSPSKAKLYYAFDIVVGVNSQVAQIIKHSYPELSEKVIYIENYLDPKYVYDELSTTDKIIRPDSDLVLCSCGRIAKEKGFDLAVEAAKCLKIHGVNFHWFFVGGGAEEDSIRKMIVEYSLCDNITITGFINNPFAYISMCDIYVQPSYEEAHATTMVESRILCKPIVSTNTASGRCFEEQYGCCVVTDIDAKSLANGIIDLYKDKERQNLIISKEKNYDYTKQKEEYVKKINALFCM